MRMSESYLKKKCTRVIGRAKTKLSHIEILHDVLFFFGGMGVKGLPAAENSKRSCNIK